MELNSIDFEFKRGAARWADTGLRYVGYGTLFGFGLIITATIILNEYLGKGLSWLKDTLQSTGNRLIGREGIDKDDDEHMKGSQEVSQTRINEPSESEHQADSDVKHNEALSTSSKNYGEIDSTIPFDESTDEVRETMPSAPVEDSAEEEHRVA